LTPEANEHLDNAYLAAFHAVQALIADRARAAIDIAEQFVYRIAELLP